MYSSIYILYIYALCPCPGLVHGYLVYLCSMNSIAVYIMFMFNEPHPCVYMDILYIYVL